MLFPCSRYVLPALVLAVVLALPTSAHAEERSVDTPSEATIDVSLEVARGALAHACKATTPTQKLRLVRRALPSIRRAHVDGHTLDNASNEARIAPKVEAVLVDVLNTATRAAIDRGSIPQAVEWNREALSLKVVSLDALLMFSEIYELLTKDIYDDLGQAAIHRIRENRAGTTLDLRDRGIARRR